MSIDTGSGQVRVSDSAGELAVDTGSGSVDLVRCRATDLTVDTGSGSVRGDEVELRRDDGGHREAETCRFSSKRMGSGEFLIDTGSGSVDLRIPAGASAGFTADAGTGGIDVSLPGAEIHDESADDLTFRTGEGGASVRIDTGSGSIRVGAAAP